MTPFELPSLEEIQEMDKQRSQAKESLEISDSDNSVVSRMWRSCTYGL
jgi:hypothetical protein